MAHTFILTEETAKSEFALLNEIHEQYVKEPWSIVGCEVVTPSGIFKNIGGFNGTPHDLWLVKKGTKGEQRKTFWRTSVGSLKTGFRVFVYDLRFANVTKDNIQEVASIIGAVITSDGMSLTHFTTETALFIVSKRNYATITEAESIIIDDEFKNAIKWAEATSGKEKSDRMASAIKGLLARNGKEKIESDFWKVARILKAKV